MSNRTWSHGYENDQSALVQIIAKFYRLFEVIWCSKKKSDNYSLRTRGVSEILQTILGKQKDRAKQKRAKMTNIANEIILEITHTHKQICLITLSTPVCTGTNAFTFDSGLMRHLFFLLWISFRFFLSFSLSFWYFGLQNSFGRS